MFGSKRRPENKLLNKKPHNLLSSGQTATAIKRRWVGDMILHRKSSQNNEVERVFGFRGRAYMGGKL